MWLIRIAAEKPELTLGNILYGATYLGHDIYCLATDGDSINLNIPDANSEYRVHLAAIHDSISVSLPAFAALRDLELNSCSQPTNPLSFLICVLITVFDDKPANALSHSPTSQNASLAGHPP